MASRILITDHVHPLLPEGLKAIGYDVDYDVTVHNDRLDDIIQYYDGLIINSKIILDKERLDKGKLLKFVGRLGSGMEIIDVAYAKKRKIKLYNSPEGNRNAVAEHEVGMILALMNNLVRADREVRNFHWDREKNRGREMKGSTIGIIGFGNTGSTLASKLSTWGMKIMAFDKYVRLFPKSYNYVHRVELTELLLKSDIISLHLPLTDETRSMVNAEFISLCKEGVIISNTSRGQILALAEVIKGLKSGKISGACLDVFENEKPDTFSVEEKKTYQELYALENVILTPHVAGWTTESLSMIASVLLDKITKGNHN